MEKPHPAIFEEALRRLGVEAKETVFVGDMVWADVQGAQALGMKAVLTHQYRQEDPGEAKPDLIVTAAGGGGGLRRPPEPRRTSATRRRVCRRQTSSPLRSSGDSTTRSAS